VASTTAPIGSRSLAIAGTAQPVSSRILPFNLSRHPAWPITALLVGYPLWWAIGISDFMWIILAVPMLLRMIGWRTRRSRALRLPPGFGIWALFLICAFAGIATIGLTAPGTAISPVSHRIFAYAYRNATYLGITVLLVYAGNLTETELPRRRIAWMLGLVAIYATVGGVAAMVDPHFQFTSPLGVVLPKSLQSNPFVHVVTTPGLAELQNVLGVNAANPRPKAPFDYTNTWGACLTMLMPWLIVGWWNGGRRRRLAVVLIAIIAAAPLLYSLNRAAWAGAGLSLAFLLFRLVARRPRALVATLTVGLVVVGVLLVATPVTSVVGGRLAHPQSNNLRGGLDALAVRDGLDSPIIGYGDTRKQIGSQKSIAVGPSAKCASCGQQEVGGTGQLWLLLVCDGVLGAILYVGFFVGGIWRYRRDRTPYGEAGVLVLLLSLLYMFTYSGAGPSLGFTMFAYVLLWRNQVERGRLPVRHRLGKWQPRLSEDDAITPQPIA
jgi:hypothetical protein